MYAEILKMVREENPLVHNITNIVVANDVANVLLAIGASPFMADSPEEMEEISSFSSALVLNIGTLKKETVKSMLLAAKAANKVGTPVILDPVGAGATRFRKEVVRQLFEEIEFTAIRGNAGELASIANVEWKAKGVDAGMGTASIPEIAEKVAKEKNCVVAISGKEDVISDGLRTIEVSNGHSRMAGITGSGCMLGGLTGAFVGVEKERVFEAVVASHIAFGLAGEHAAVRKDVHGSGTFRAALIDELENLSLEDMKNEATLKELNK